MFNEYDDYLNQDFPIDFWSDEGICAASEILGKFSVDDWNALAANWRGNSSAWKVRCAETIDSYPSQFVLGILLQLLEEDDSDVVIAAADSLRSLKPAELCISPATLARIAILRNRSGLVIKKILSDFIQRTRKDDLDS